MWWAGYYCHPHTSGFLWDKAVTFPFVNPKVVLINQCLEACERQQVGQVQLSLTWAPYSSSPAPQIRQKTTKNVSAFRSLVKPFFIFADNKLLFLHSCYIFPLCRLYERLHVSKWRPIGQPVYREQTLHPFCNRVKRDPLETECSEDRNSVALCNLVQHNYPLPDIYQVNFSFGVLRQMNEVLWFVSLFFLLVNRISNLFHTSVKKTFHSTADL